jgi:hypothetical protein
MVAVLLLTDTVRCLTVRYTSATVVHECAVRAALRLTVTTHRRCHCHCANECAAVATVYTCLYGIRCANNC